MGLSQVSTTQVLRWVLSICGFFVAWEIVGRMDVMPIIRPFSRVMEAMWESITIGDLLAAAGGTLKIALTGYVIAVVVGLPLGVLLGLSRTMASVVDPLIDILWSVPLYMFIPLLALYFGLGFEGKVVLVVLFCFVLVTVNTAAGFRRVPRGLLDMAKVFGISRSKAITQVMLPSARPYVLHALSLSMGRAVQAAVGADLLLSIANLGLFLSTAGAKFQLAKLLGGTLFIALVATGVVGIGRLIEWRFHGSAAYAKR